VLGPNLLISWLFGQIGCNIGAAIIFFISSSSVYIVLALSLQRYYIIYNPLNIRQIKPKTTSIIIAICLGSGLILSIFPISGWGYYTLEGVLTSCSVEFRLKDLNTLSFNIFLYIAVFAVPFAVIIFFNIILYKKVIEK